MDRLAREVGQAEVRGWLTEPGSGRSSWCRRWPRAIALDGSQRPRSQHRQADRTGDQATNGIGTLSQWTANGAIGTHEHCAGRARGLVGLGHFAILLQKQLRDAKFTGFAAVRFRCATTNDRQGELARIVALPVSYLGQERRAGTTARVRKEQQHRGVLGTQGLQRKPFSFHRGEGKAGSLRTNVEASRPCCRLWHSC